MQVQLTKEILKLVRNHADKKGMSLSEFARQANISKAWLSELKNHDANLSVETATYLLEVIGYKLVVQKKSGGSAEAAATEEKITASSSRLRKVVECQNISYRS